VLALVPDRWSERWQPRHHVLTRLARYMRVVWVNPAPEWRDVARHPRGFRVMEPHPAPGLSVHSPDLYLPRVYRPGPIGAHLFRQRLRGARRALLRAGCTRIVLYVWRPHFADALSAVPFDLSCYHIDDEYSFSPIEQPISPPELRLLTDCDQVFIHSPELLAKKGMINPNTTFVPNGVDYDAFARPAPMPRELAAIPRPRIGYVGWLKRQLDWPLLRSLADAHPDWSLVLVGGQKNHESTAAPIAELSRRANVHLLGARPTAQLSAYPQHFDVCIMPYRVDDYTKYIYPMKLHEYLAAGRPVVGAPIPALEPFAHVVACPRTLAEWSDAVTALLRPEENTPEKRAARQRVARAHDWDTLVERIAHTIVERMGTPGAPEHRSRSA
jgi:glycosyltransferase involved in cell wall biosynthesis